MRAALLACVLPFLAAAEAAAEENCRNFSWSVGRTIDLFDEPLPVVQSGQSLPKEGVFTLRLAAMSEVIYPVTPDRGADSGYGGFVAIESLPVGRYRVLLSDVAWLDAVLDNQRLPILAFDRSDDCPGVHQIMEFDVRGQPLVLQVSGAPFPVINIAVRRVWEFEWRW